MTTVLRLRPWWRGPLLLLRRPGVALALTAAAFVAALPAAAAPLFLSAARSATLHSQLDAGCPWLVGGQVSSRAGYGPAVTVGDEPAADRFTTSGGALADTRRDIAFGALAGVDGLAPPVGTEYAAVTLTAAGSDDPTAATLASRDGFAEHVEPVAGPDGAGVWISDRHAALDDLAVGDTLVTRLQAPRGQPSPEHRLRVAAVYRDLRGRPDDPWWCSMREVYRGRPGQEFGNTPVPQLVLADRDTFRAAADALRSDGTQLVEYRLADTRLTQPQARRLADRIEAAHRRMAAAQPPVLHPARYVTRLGAVADRSQLVRDSLVPPVAPITAVGAGVGLLVVAAAGIFWVQRRRVELTVLAAHGVGGAALGVKAVAEALPALTVGALAGGGCAWALVRGVGPSPVLSAEAVPLAVAATLGALAAAAAVAGVSAGLRCRSLVDQVRPHRRLRLAAVPWELLLLAAAGPAWSLLAPGAGAADTAGLGTVATVPARLLLVPILVIVGLAALAVRLGARWLRRGATRRRPAGRALLLAWRRLARDPVVAAVLAAATAVPIALAAYGAVVTGSVQATLATEARVRVGADAVLTLTERTAPPAAYAGRATEVLRLGGALVDGVRVDLLGVDPATFARDARWDARLSGASLADLVRGLRPPDAPGGEFPAVASGAIPGGTQQVSWGGPTLGTARVRSVPMLPAQQGGYPVMLVHRDALGADTRYAVPQLWVRGEPAEIRRAAAAARLPLTRFTGADEIYAGTLFEPLTYTFDYLMALSLLTALIATVGLLLYLEGRAALHRRGYVLLRRMGLRPGTHRRALMTELALPLGAGLVGGLATTLAIATVLRDQFEVNPAVPPRTVLTLPVGTLGGIAALVVVVTLGAAAYAHRRVARADPSEVLRDTT